jgi:hypothetical protein
LTREHKATPNENRAGAFDPFRDRHPRWRIQIRIQEGFMLLVNMDHHHSVSMVRRSGWLLEAGVFSWAQVKNLDARPEGSGRRA